MATKDNYLALYGAIGPALAGSRTAWVQELRAAALARFAEQGFPTPRQEEWKYTDVGVLQRREYHPATAGADGVTEQALAPFVFQGCHRRVFVNGHYAPSLSTPDTLPHEVSMGSLAQALDQEPDALQCHLGQYAREDGNSLVALNTAFMADGAYVHLAPGAVLETPIHLIYLSTAAGDGLAAYPRNLVVAEDGSRATLIESFIGLGNGNYFTNGVTELALGRNAGIERYVLQQENAQAVHVSSSFVHQPRDSRYTSHCISLGAALARNEIHVVLDGAGSECTLNGLYLADGRQHVDNHTLIDHAQPRGTSLEYYKGVLDGRARAVFSGKIIVRPDAQHTDAQQTNHNLLLSRDAEADSRPQLEIYADDVKCSHGATVGQLDKDALYYLQSRAIDHDTARNLLIYAFANDILTRLKIAPLRERLEHLLTHRLLHGQAFEDLR